MLYRLDDAVPVIGGLDDILSQSLYRLMMQCIYFDPLLFHDMP